MIVMFSPDSINKVSNPIENRKIKENRESNNKQGMYVFNPSNIN